jgi:uncharacterized phage-associated protein
MLEESSSGESQAMLAALDPRSVCNLMLDEARGLHPISHIALQKLLYFAHGIYLMRTNTPLISGYFEAWQRGPVHPAAYVAFKAAGADPIEFRALSHDPLTGAISHIPNPTNDTVVRLVRHVILAYAGMTVGQLIRLSHARNGPWHYVVDKARTSIAFGMRIPDTVIRARFKYHKVGVDLAPEACEPSEDTPFA